MREVIWYPIGLAIGYQITLNVHTPHVSIFAIIITFILSTLVEDFSSFCFPYLKNGSKNDNLAKKSSVYFVNC